MYRERERGADRQEALITAGLYHRLLKPAPQVKRRHTFATESIKVQTITLQEAAPQARQQDMPSYSTYLCHGPLA